MSLRQKLIALFAFSIASSCASPPSQGAQALEDGSRSLGLAPESARLATGRHSIQIAYATDDGLYLLTSNDAPPQKISDGKIHEFGFLENDTKIIYFKETSTSTTSSNSNSILFEHDIKNKSTRVLNEKSFGPNLYISPDGSHFGFTEWSPSGPQRGVSVYDRDSKSFKSLAPNQFATEIRWSPDNRTIAFLGKNSPELKDQALCLAEVSSKKIKETGTKSEGNLHTLFWMHNPPGIILPTLRTTVPALTLTTFTPEGVERSKISVSLPEVIIGKPLRNFIPSPQGDFLLSEVVLGPVSSGNIGWLKINTHSGEITFLEKGATLWAWFFSGDAIISSTGQGQARRFRESSL